MVHCKSRGIARPDSSIIVASPTACNEVLFRSIGNNNNNSPFVKRAYLELFSHKREKVGESESDWKESTANQMETIQYCVCVGGGIDSPPGACWRPT